MNPPNPTDRARCFDLRCRTKRGEYIRPGDLIFCERIWRKFPDWYSSLNPQIIEATLPLGARGELR